MKKSTWLIIAGLAVVVIWGIKVHNNLVDQEEAVKEYWSNVESAYQRRADLIPNLVNVVKGYAAHEEKTFLEVTEARKMATEIKLDPSNMTPEEFEEYVQKFQKAQGEIGTALSKLIAVQENYPELKANENFLDLQKQLEGTENRINTVRNEYNERVKAYNVTARKFPGSIVASIFGFNVKSGFKADEGAENAPKVSFD